MNTYLTSFYTILLPRHWQVFENKDKKYKNSQEVSFLASIFQLGQSGLYLTEKVKINPDPNVDFYTNNFATNTYINTEENTKRGDSVMDFSTELVNYIEDLLTPGWQDSLYKTDDINAIRHHIYYLLAEKYQNSLEVHNLQEYLEKLTEIVLERK